MGHYFPRVVVLKIIFSPVTIIITIVMYMALEKEGGGQPINSLELDPLLLPLPSPVLVILMMAMMMAEYGDGGQS